MTVPFARKLRSVVFPATLGLFSGMAGAQSAEADTGATLPEAAAGEALPPYHHSTLSWEHAVTTETLGVGDTPQSSNPTYDMGLVAKGRYYLQDDTPAGKHLSLRLDGGLYREFTNSDVTTRRGEWTFSDTDLALAYARRIRGPADADGTLAELRPLRLTLPTSPASFDSGRYFAAGALVGITNVSPLLRGRVRTEISSSVRLAAGYKRWFARATVPTNPSLERVRLTPEGRSLPGDVLSGASLVRDQLDFSLLVALAFGQDVVWSTGFAFAPSWKYAAKDNVALCGVVLTGCTNVQLAADDSRYLVQTQFNTEVSVRVVRAFSLELGYGNSANQLGADGRRRGIFYSPAAVFYASLTFSPHELTTSSKQMAQRRSASPNL